jgi:hypothetical protein
MPLPEFTKRLVEITLLTYCHNKVPEHARQEVKIYFKVRGDNVTIYESRPYHLDPSVWKEKPVARFRYDQESKKWSLYCADRNSKWHPHTEAEPSLNFDDLVKAIDRDPTGIFWG